MGVLIMSECERQRKAVCEMVNQQRITLVQAAEQRGLSYRQILRIYERYKEKGDAGLIHGNRGRVSSRKNTHQETIINRYIERYEGFGPTLASEYLERDGFLVDHDTLRKWWFRKRSNNERSMFRYNKVARTYNRPRRLWLIGWHYASQCSKI
ncbi:helix-turn-helix domain-containing protein [Legionella impletisoli]|uniref:Transposase n=1 Tax=Legionella impletisoli TaxID=343510 RepID=A0A917NCB7_9GAMM|nr:helix-turn-helix domain-containing protein [Legionella impletisoli]GGI87967.1 hypothetical protein GCM10007966_15900 [Legionella impletisoli]